MAQAARSAIASRVEGLNQGRVDRKVAEHGRHLVGGRGQPRQAAARKGGAAGYLGLVRDASGYSARSSNSASFSALSEVSCADHWVAGAASGGSSAGGLQWPWTLCSMPSQPTWYNPVALDLCGAAGCIKR